MLSRIIAFISASLFLVFPFFSFCAEWRVENLEVYVGDYNSDGRQDIYLKAINFTSVDGSINQPPFKSQILLRDGARYKVIYNLDKRRLEGTAWVAAPFHHYTADVDGDTRSELILQPLETSGELLVISPDESKDSVIFQASGQELGMDISFNNGSVIEFLGKALGGSLSVRITHPRQGATVTSLERTGWTYATRTQGGEGKVAILGGLLRHMRF